MDYKGIPNEHLIPAVPYYRAAGTGNKFLSRVNRELDVLVRNGILLRTPGSTQNASSEYSFSQEAWEYMMKTYGANE